MSGYILGTADKYYSLAGIAFYRLLILFKRKTFIFLIPFIMEKKFTLLKIKGPFELIFDLLKKITSFIGHYSIKEFVSNRFNQCQKSNH